MKVVNGTTETLEIKAIVYSRLNADPPKILATYLSRDYHDIEEVIQHDLKMTNAEKIDLLQRLKDYSKQWNIFAVGYDVKDEKEILWGVETVIFAGEYDTEQECNDNLKLAMNSYVIMQASNLERGVKPKNTFIRTHMDILPENMVTYLTQDYVVPLLMSIEAGDAEGLNQKRQELAKFCYGTSFYRDAEALFYSLSRPNHKRTERIILDIALKSAVEKQAFELAAELRDKRQALE